MKNLKYKCIDSDTSKLGFTLEIHLTEVCNYNCSYCNLHNMNRYDKIDYDKLFSVEYPSNTRAFILGGEPTVDKNLFELIEKLNEHQIYDIDIQTNLSTNIQKIIEKLQEKKLNVKFFSSFHNEFADFKTFITKNKFLVESGYYGGIHYMWTKRFSALSYNRFKILNSIFDNVSLEPTYPHSAIIEEWDKKEELNAFKELDLMQHSKRLAPIIKIDNDEMSVGEALLNNYERGVNGIECEISKYAITFSVTKNNFYNCCFDLVLNNPPVKNPLKCSSCVCVNKICCDDLQYPKRRSK